MPKTQKTSWLSFAAGPFGYWAISFLGEFSGTVVSSEEWHVVVLGSHDEDPVELLALADVTAQEVNA